MRCTKLYKYYNIIPSSYKADILVIQDPANDDDIDLVNMIKEWTKRVKAFLCKVNMELEIQQTM